MPGGRLVRREAPRSRTISTRGHGGGGEPDGHLPLRGDGFGCVGISGVSLSHIFLFLFVFALWLCPTQLVGELPVALDQSEFVGFALRKAGRPENVID